MYLTIESKTLEKYKKELLKTYEESLGENPDETYGFQEDKLVFSCEDLEFKNGELEVTLILEYKGDQVLYTTVSIPVDLDLTTEIVNDYMKKLGKLKTILEATKGV